MRNIEIRDCLYQYSIHQSREQLPRLLMLHGFMGNHSAFEHIIDKLCAFCNPITIDLLGHGKSAKPNEPARYDEQEQVDDLLQFIEKLNLSPLYLYGYSMGGRLALKTALAEPVLFSGLVLESTNPGIYDESDRKKRRKTDSQRAQQIEDDFPEFLMKWQKLDLFQSPLPTDHQLEKKYQRMQSEQSPEALSASLKGFGTGSMTAVWDQLETLELPILLLAGSGDKKYLKINQKMLEKIPNTVFASVEAGHRIHLDNPRSFTAKVNTYFSSIT